MKAGDTGKKGSGSVFPVSAFVALTALPLAVVVAMSFAARGRPVTWTLDGSAWLRLLDARWAQVLGRSATTAAATTAICVAVGVPLAWWIARRPPRARRVLSFLVLVPLWANTVALLYAWTVILRGDGALDAFARALGLLGDGGRTGLLHTPAAVLIGLVHTFLPYMVWAVLQSAERFDLRLLDAAQDLGATRAQALRRVLLPALRPGIVTGTLLVFVPALGTFVVPDLLGGGLRLHVGNAVRDLLLQDPSDWPLAAAMSASLLAMTLASAWIWSRAGRA